MRLNAFEALCAKAGKLKRAIGVFSWQDTLQQRDNLTSCSKKQDLSQGHWKNDANFIAGATVTSSNGSFCRQLDVEQVRHLFEKRILSKLDWQMSYNVLQLQHLSKIVQAELVTSKKDVGHAAMPSAVRLKL